MQTPMASGQTFKNFFSGAPSLHHHSGSLSAAASDSAFRSPDMHVSFPPLSASSADPAASPSAAHRGEMRGQQGGGSRALGTSRTTGSASWGKTRAPVKRRGSLSSLGEGSSSGPHQQQRQTLKLADITDFDLTRPSAFDKLSDLYRDRSTLEGPSAHALIGREDWEKEGSGKLKPKSKSGPISHHVHLPKISMDSSPPLVSFRHSRIKPSTVTEHETGMPGKTQQPSPRTPSSFTASEVKLAPQTLPLRKHESPRDKNNAGATMTDKNHSSVDRQKQLHVNTTSTLPSVPSPKAVSGGYEKQDSTTSTSPQHRKDVESTASNSKARSGTGHPQASKRRGSAEVESLSAPNDVTTSSDTSINSPLKTTLAPADSRGSAEPEPDNLSLSPYTSIVINNDGWEGETLSTVKSDTFLGERRTVRFSVSTEVIEYEPGSSLTGIDKLSVDVEGDPCEAFSD